MATDQPRPEVTRWLAERAAKLSLDDLSPEGRHVVRHCILDWIAVTLPGTAEPATRILAETLLADGAAPAATLVGGRGRTSVLNAAVINGTASHALDYDDVNMAFVGHPTVAILPALLAVAEDEGASADALIEAFAAGYDVVCRVGVLVSPAHYADGFHVTATAGSIGAAAGVARLMGLSAAQTAVAMGLAATMGPGLKSMFGTMAKPLHAGRAAQNGILAAQLAARGFTARPDALECEQGFAATQSTDFNAAEAMANEPADAHLRANLFKYHAACYLTHGAIEAAGKLRQDHGIAPARIEKITITVAPGSDRVCNIASPATGLEAKFSLKLTAAMALAGRDTSGIAVYTDDLTRDPELIRLRDATTVEFSTQMGGAEGQVSIRAGGRIHAAGHDAGLPNRDLADQERKLSAKFDALVTPILGTGRTAELKEAILGFGGSNGLHDILNLAETAP